MKINDIEDAFIRKLAQRRSDTAKTTWKNSYKDDQKYKDGHIGHRFDWAQTIEGYGFWLAVDDGDISYAWEIYEKNNIRQKNSTLEDCLTAIQDLKSSMKLKPRKSNSFARHKKS